MFGSVGNAPYICEVLIKYLLTTKTSMEQINSIEVINQEVLIAHYQPGLRDQIIRKLAATAGVHALSEGLFEIKNTRDDLAMTHTIHLRTYIMSPSERTWLISCLQEAKKQSTEESVPYLTQIEKLLKI